MKKILITLLIGVNALMSFAQVPSYVPTSGLAGYWPFNGNANDESGNGNNGTVNGATLTSDRNGVANKAYSFDGSDWIEVMNSTTIQPSTAFSISAWVFVESSQPSLGGNYTRIISKNHSEAQNFATYQLITGLNTGYGKAGVCIRTGSGISAAGNNGIYTWTGATNNLIGQYQLIVGTYNGSELKIYQNGVLSSSLNYTGNLFYDSGKLWFGRGKSGASAPGTDMFFNGKIDDIGIWNRALTQTEITTLYNGCATPTALAGGSTTICSNGSATVSGASSTNGTILWTSTGAGTITAGTETTLAPTYNAVAGDTGSTVTLTMTVTSNNSCGTLVTANYTINVTPLPTATISALGTTTFCQGGSVVLNASSGSGYTYEWYKNGTIINGSTTSTYTANQSGIYTVKVINGSCNASSSATTVTVNPNPTATISALGSTTFCQGGSVVLNASTGAGYAYEWYKDGNIINGSTTSSYIANQSGNYTVKVTNGLCNTTSVATTVTVNPNPTVSFTTLASYTDYQNAPIALIGAPSGGTFSGPGVSGNIFTPSIAGLGTKIVTYNVSNSDNCWGSAFQSTIVYDTLGVVCTTYDTITVTDTLFITTTLGLSSPTSNTIKIYPNPANDHITIDNGNFATMPNYTIRIDNALGQQVFLSVINQQSFYVDLSSWSGDGVYFVYLKDAQGTIKEIRKIVLQ